MIDTKVFGRNHAMRAMLGLIQDEYFRDAITQLLDIQKKIKKSILNEDQIKTLIKLNNEFAYQLNKRIVESGDKTDSRIPSISREYAGERTSNSTD